MADQEEVQDIRKPFHDKLSEMKEKAGKVTEEDVRHMETLPVL